jgi:hypothetical protein
MREEGRVMSEELRVKSEWRGGKVRGWRREGGGLG